MRSNITANSPLAAGDIHQALYFKPSASPNQDEVTSKTVYPCKFFNGMQQAKHSKLSNMALECCHAHFLADFWRLNLWKGILGGEFVEVNCFGRLFAGRRRGRKFGLKFISSAAELDLTFGFWRNRIPSEAFRLDNKP